MRCIKILDRRLTILDFRFRAHKNELSILRGLKLLQSKIVNLRSEIILSRKNQLISF
jgi:hypothetical protein